ncbi:hypothetical protein COU77_01555 [Candidatus Peregrinibacteria bacterium CG10_big_fil_rev_8_21_14_0_10_49_16]|nr:MAG: hypothetical protein COU77_01555 [Candidatus Peregrinibacteria bacterium CG10_big_fil_rev_8_21_14_0_10_49_16]
MNSEEPPPTTPDTQLAYKAHTSDTPQPDLAEGIRSPTEIVEQIRSTIEDIDKIKGIDVFRQNGYAFVYISKKADWNEIDWSSKSILKELFVNSGTTFFFAHGKDAVNAETFFSDYPAYSWGIDGFVDGPPEVREAEEGDEEDGPRVNSDHHSGLDRYSTFATCFQIYMHIKERLVQKFKRPDDDKPNLNIFFNDIDEDILMSLWLFRNHTNIGENTEDDALRPLLTDVGLLDMTSTTFPLPQKRKEEIKWMFYPFMSAKRGGYFEKLTITDVAYLLERTFHNIDETLEGRGGRIPLADTYEILGGGGTNGNRWHLIREEGSEARGTMMKDGIHTGIVHIRAREDDHHTYTVIKLAEESTFPITELFPFFNQIEAIKSEVVEEWKREYRNANSDELEQLVHDIFAYMEEHSDLEETESTWGGGNMIGGSPRSTGSWIWPALMQPLTNRFLMLQEAKKEHANGNGKSNGRANGERLLNGKSA